MNFLKRRMCFLPQPSTVLYKTSFRSMSSTPALSASPSGAWTCYSSHTGQSPLVTPDPNAWCLGPWKSTVPDSPGCIAPCGQWLLFQRQSASQVLWIVLVEVCLQARLNFLARSGEIVTSLAFTISVTLQMSYLFLYGERLYFKIKNQPSEFLLIASCHDMIAAGTTAR